MNARKTGATRTADSLEAGGAGDSLARLGTPAHACTPSKPRQQAVYRVRLSSRSPRARPCSRRRVRAALTPSTLAALYRLVLTRRPAYMSTLLNKPFDAFADEGVDEDIVEDVAADGGKVKGSDHIHIRIQQRNGRKTITTLQGLPKEYDPKKLLKAFKKEFACNGSIVDDATMGQVIQLQGDQRTKIAEILSAEGIEKQTIKVHGF